MKKGMQMKINRINSMSRLAGITVALALIAGSGGLAQAQYKATGDDGIAASPKLRQFLDEYKRGRTPAPPPKRLPQMSCPKCKDEHLRRVDWSARGAYKPSITVTKHLCGGCRNTWLVSGHGRAKTTTAVHTCTSCGEENLACCSTGKSGITATKGMEKKLQVAPVK